MADVEKVEFEFPDEKEAAEQKAEEVKAEAESEIEVVDDTPEQDRGRRPLDEPPKEFAEDELAKYDASVQSRIKHFTKGYHDERRAKEAAFREKEEALRLAQSILEENKKLKGSIDQKEAVMLDGFKKLAATEFEKAKAKYKEAYESGDSDAVAEAQAALTAATVRLERVQNIKPRPLQPEENEVKPEPPAAAPAPLPDYKAQKWQQENQWFGKDEEMTSFALGLHTKLINSGVDPRSDEYYERLNGRLKQVFPEAFEAEKPVEAPTPRPKSNVAPATRSTAPKKIVLTQTQVNIAKRLGVPLELYARKVAEEMRK
jgi:hypothetical protein